MTHKDDQVSRRQLTQWAGLGIAGAIAFGHAPRTEGSDEAKGNAPGQRQYWTAEYRASNGATSLYLYRKRKTAPRAGEPPSPVLFFAHGSSISSRPSFDLTVPHAGEYSMMNVFADAGFDTWTMDFSGYGRSVPAPGNSDIQAGVSDLRAAVPLIQHETGHPRLHFYGESSGAIRVAAFAMIVPESVDRLVLAAFTYTGKGSPTLAKRAEGLDFFRTHDRRPRDRAAIHNIFTRDKPGTTDSRVADAVADAELTYGDSVPTGTYLDMTAHLPLAQPEQITAPVLLVRGEYDGISTLEDLDDFFNRLPNGDRQFVIIPNAAHALTTCYNRMLLWHATRSFLSMPPKLPLVLG
jgi:pimeloyl-ACP methyl ester carboxylesterase